LIFSQVYIPLRDCMRIYLKCIPGVIALMAAVLLLLPSINAQESNTALNNTILENTTLNNTTLNYSGAGGDGSSTPSSTQSIASPQESSSSNAGIQMGKGMNENVIDTSSLNKDSTSFSINHGGISSPFQIGQAEKPVRDLEKVVFICNIV
jgi:hypothetical protein